MRQIPVDTSSAVVMVAKTPQVKVRDRRTGEIATDMETGAQLMTVDVMFAAVDTTKATGPLALLVHSLLSSNARTWKYGS